jgi:hypothetical protein
MSPLNTPIDDMRPFNRIELVLKNRQRPDQSACKLIFIYYNN